MSSKDYNLYLDAIKAAYDIDDSDERKAALEKIKCRLIQDYSLQDDDVQYLLRKL